MQQNLNIKFLVISFFILWVHLRTYSQQLNYSLDFKTSQQISYLLQQGDSIYNSTVKPISENNLQLLNISDTSLNNPERDKKYLTKHKANWIYRKLRKEDFIDFKTEGFHFRVNPLFHF